MDTSRPAPEHRDVPPAREPGDAGPVPDVTGAPPADRTRRPRRAGSAGPRRPRRHRAGTAPPAALGLGLGDPATVLGLHGPDPVPAAGDPADDDADPGPERANLRGRRRLLLAVLAGVAVASATALVVGLVGWAPEETPPPRNLTAAERDRLAAVRVTNFRDLRAGLRVTAGTGADRTDVVGWVDWARPLVYVDVGGPGAGPIRGLVQATPRVVLVRPDPGAVPTPAEPPLVPPTDRWRLPDSHDLDALLALVFALAADRPDPSGATDGGRWVGRETVAGQPVDVLEAPAPAAAGATARHWVDEAARLHRLETRLPGMGPVSVHLDRANRPTLRPVDGLGGRPGLPRALTAAERDRIRRLPARLRAARGATVTLTAPLGTNLRGAGWLDWRAGRAYLSVADLAEPQTRTLVRHGREGVTRRADGPGAGTPETPGPPPLPAPRTGWRSGSHPTEALVPLVDAALRAAVDGPRGGVRRLRGDGLGGTTVDVVESRVADATMRWWIDRAGLLRRVETRTPAGAWAQLDLHPGRVPDLPGR
ncbi:hypothetical protein GA0070616_0802 [Micromonospora nigra]|uniref:Uncharacterized protein n=1 Tax=Micromonospora nigra TaxID=145857 RepID=A0A1C6RF39_9ACTN|nr:hypothetical protein [Micromonospora nigra]SCL15695.1 hypothetical protein GA0070616_0802 [Micromonospora nigra]